MSSVLISFLNISNFSCRLFPIPISPLTPTLKVSIYFKTLFFMTLTFALDFVVFRPTRN